jgi:hypothetical protein
MVVSQAMARIVVGILTALAQTLSLRVSRSLGSPTFLVSFVVAASPGISVGGSLLGVGCLVVWLALRCWLSQIDGSLTRSGHLIVSARSADWLSPYAWLAGFDGCPPTQALRSLQPFRIDIQAMGMAEVRDRIGIATGSPSL